MNNDIKIIDKNITYPPKSMSEPIVNPLPGVPVEGNSPYPMGVEGGESGASPPSFRAIGSADAQDINRKPWTLYSAGMADPLPDLQNFFQPQASEVDIPNDYLCPITRLLFRDPVVTCDGQTYEREAIKRWFGQGKTTSPLTNLELKNTEFFPIIFAKNVIDSFVAENPALKDSGEWYLPYGWVTELQTACQTGNEERIRQLAERDRRLLVFPLKTDEKASGETALHFAAAGDPLALDTIIELLEKRQPGLAQAGLLQRNEQGKLPFHLALLAKQNAQTLIKIMSWMGKYVDRIKALKDSQNDSQWPLNEALTWCIEKKDEDKIECLRRLGAEPFNEAHFQIGLNYFFSEKFPLALPYFMEAMQLDYPPACLFSAIIHREDKSLSAYYLRQAGTHQTWFHAQAKTGNPLSQFYLGLFYQYSQKNYIQMAACYLKAATQKYPPAQFYLGISYLDGRGVFKDEKEAIVWYRKAAEQGLPGAQRDLGLCYEKGQGVAKDEKEAVAWYRKAAEQANPTAQLYLGICYEDGYGVVKDQKEAVIWYRRAAEQANPTAQFNLGICYEDGYGVVKDQKEAVIWYRRAAEQGNPTAQIKLGICYSNGYGVVQDDKEAIIWCRKSAEQGNPKAQFNLGFCYTMGRGVVKDEKEAVVLYRKAAEQGHREAQFNLGLCYTMGQGVVKDEKEAVIWHRKAAEQGNPDAQVYLGTRYEYGRGVAKNAKEAVTWYQKAAEQANPTAQFNLGICYENGYGVVKDEKEAVAWYRKAAEQEHPSAQYRLGHCYEQGKGVKKNDSEAIFWYNKAEAQKNESAKNAKNMLLCGNPSLAQNVYITFSTRTTRRKANIFQRIFSLSSKK